jgi:hypothetical protein
MARADLIGCYSIGRDPWRLVELRLSDVPAPFDLAKIVLPVPDQPASNWQVPWDERILDSDGETQLANHEVIERRPDLLAGNVRLCFFLCAVSDELLRTPFGSLSLTPVSVLPDRLRSIEFEEP